MQIQALNIPEVLLITPPRIGDERGFFAETYSAPKLNAAGITFAFVQDNQSFSAAVGTIRGLHCQLAPHAQGKLVRVHRDIPDRAGSPSFGQYAAAELSAENFAQLWIPAGFLHGFCTLTPDAEIFYKVTGLYDRGAERGVAWDDATLALPWPLPAGGPVLSEKDKLLPGWGAAAPWFA